MIIILSRSPCNLADDSISRKCHRIVLRNIHINNPTLRSVEWGGLGEGFGVGSRRSTGIRYIHVLSGLGFPSSGTFKRSTQAHKEHIT